MQYNTYNKQYKSIQLYTMYFLESDFTHSIQNRETVLVNIEDNIIMKLYAR